jgi:hypothetical protein
MPEDKKVEDELDVDDIDTEKMPRKVRDLIGRQGAKIEKLETQVREFIGASRADKELQALRDKVSKLETEGETKRDKPTTKADDDDPIVTFNGKEYHESEFLALRAKKLGVEVDEKEDEKPSRTEMLDKSIQSVAGYLKEANRGVPQDKIFAAAQKIVLTAVEQTDGSLDAAAALLAVEESQSATKPEVSIVKLAKIVPTVGSIYAVYKEEADEKAKKDDKAKAAPEKTAEAEETATETEAESTEKETAETEEAVAETAVPVEVASQKKPAGETAPKGASRTSAKNPPPVAVARLANEKADATIREINKRIFGQEEVPK